MSVDLPIWSVVETAGTLYQKDTERFHLLLTEPLVQDWQPRSLQHPQDAFIPPTPRLLWLEISPYRVIMTMQGNGKFSYRHLWEPGVYGLSRYWLQTEVTSTNEPLHIRNFTRSLAVIGNSLPERLRVEYELWSDKLQLGRYVLNVEISDTEP